MLACVAAALRAPLHVGVSPADDIIQVEEFMADHPGLLGGGLPWREGEGGPSSWLASYCTSPFPDVALA